MVRQKIWRMAARIPAAAGTRILTCMLGTTAFSPKRACGAS